MQGAESTGVKSAFEAKTDNLAPSRGRNWGYLRDRGYVNAKGSAFLLDRVSP